MQPTDGAHVTLRPVAGAEITGGFWHARREVNATVSIPEGAGHLESAGNLHNLRLAAGLTDTAAGGYRGDLPFLDSDVYKWLEAVAWRLAAAPPHRQPPHRQPPDRQPPDRQPPDRQPPDGQPPGGQHGPGGGHRPGEPDTSRDPDTYREQADPAKLAARRDEIIGLLAAAQRADGYLQSYFQVARPGQRFTDLQWGHELYCAGHLIQAAVADARSAGRDDLLRIARRAADHIAGTLGPGRTDGVGGHPGIETALVELYRCTGERRYLDLAGHLIDQRGRGLLGDGRFGRDYWQDSVPLRDAAAVTGHAVRQFYLLAGAADVCSETGDASLLSAVVRLWEDAASTRTYLTGGTGSHHTDESFGDPYELPPERAYCETCAAIASVMLSWRLLLITGEARYADLMERTLYNGVLPGVSPDGRGYHYVNPLQVRPGSAGAAGDQSAGRKAWFRCACCPPNIMRLLASLQHYLAAASPDGLWVCHYATATLRSEAAGQPVRLDMSAGYPWHGRITLTVAATGGSPWTLALRVPGWCPRAQVTVNGEPIGPAAFDGRETGSGTGSGRNGAGWLRVTRRWRAGDTVVLDLAMAPRLTAGHPRADAVRGCVAIERGPLVYCLEQIDQPAGARLDDVAIDGGAPLRDHDRAPLLGDVMTVTASGFLREPGGPSGPGGSDGPGRPGGVVGSGGSERWWPYRPADAPGADRWQPVTLTAIPYLAWANRGSGAMRVWISRHDPR